MATTKPKELPGVEYSRYPKVDRAYLDHCAECGNLIYHAATCSYSQPTITSDTVIEVRDITNLQSLEYLVPTILEGIRDPNVTVVEHDLWRIAHNAVAFYRKNVGRSFVDSDDD